MAARFVTVRIVRRSCDEEWRDAIARAQCVIEVNHWVGSIRTHHETFEMYGRNGVRTISMAIHEAVFSDPDAGAAFHQHFNAPPELTL